MKPFRGKPEKPERLNEKIQRISSSVIDGLCDKILNYLNFAPAVYVLSLMNACTSSLVKRRDPLNIDLRVSM